ncbi:MAG: NADH-quinone oxidoreductase subunit J [bacterium]
MFEGLFFFIFSAITIVAAAMVLISKNAVHSMLWLVLTFFTTACLFVLRSAEFVAVIQIMVYAGGVVVLYVFAIMLIDLKNYRKLIHFHKNHRLTIGIGIVMFMELVLMLSSRGRLIPRMGNMAAGLAKWGGNSELIGKTLFTDFIFPFELVSILLLVALIGAVVLGRPEKGER